MKLGIIQGRLSRPIEGHQTTPSDWHKEFIDMRALRLSHLEWTVDNKKLNNNPIFLDNTEKFHKKISSICFDNLVCRDFYNLEFLKPNLFNLVELLVQKDLNCITLPLVEEATLRDDSDINFVRKITDILLERYSCLEINIESDASAEKIKQVIKPNKNVNFTYDTGNITASNFDHRRYISLLFDNITNVHLKDRKHNSGPSMKFGYGDTDFNFIFKTLSELNYSNIFTLQMVRGVEGEEFNYIKDLSHTFKDLYEKYF